MPWVTTVTHIPPPPPLRRSPVNHSSVCTLVVTTWQLGVCRVPFLVPEHLHNLPSSLNPRKNNTVKMAAVSRFPSTHEDAEENNNNNDNNAPGGLTAPAYRPLEVFGGTAEGPGSAPCSEADDICELCIRLKEIELCGMMREAPGVPAE